MTRSIGDLDLKPNGVIALPDTRTYEVIRNRNWTTTTALFTGFLHPRSNTAAMHLWHWSLMVLVMWWTTGKWWTLYRAATIQTMRPNLSPTKHYTIRVMIMPPRWWCPLVHGESLKIIVIRTINSSALADNYKTVFASEQKKTTNLPSPICTNLHILSVFSPPSVNSLSSNYWK